MRSVGITHSGGNLNRVIGMYKAFIQPTMEYALGICIPNASLIKVLERCQGGMLRTMLGVPKSTSYVAILLLCIMEAMEHRWRAKISSCIHHHQLDTDNKHIINGLFNIERVVLKKSSPLSLQALRSTNNSATRVAQTMSLGFTCSMFVQHRTPIIHWLLGAVAVQPSLHQKCGGTMSRDHAADCISAATKLGPLIANAICKLRGQQRQHQQQANAIDAALMVLNKNNMASAIKIALVIGKIYTHCL
ncbi:hypothetical protein GGI09_006604, partial [Coemansia sp. S100]